MALTKQNKLDQLAGDFIDNQTSLGTTDAPTMPADGLLFSADGTQIIDAKKSPGLGSNGNDLDPAIAAQREQNRFNSRPDAYVPMGELTDGNGKRIPSLSEQAAKPGVGYQAPVPYDQDPTRPSLTPARTDRQRPLDQPIYTGGAIPEGGLAPGVAEGYQRGLPPKPAAPAATAPATPAKATAPAMAPAPTAPAKAPAPTAPAMAPAPTAPSYDPAKYGATIVPEQTANEKIIASKDLGVSNQPLTTAPNGLNSVDSERYRRGQDFLARQKSGQMQGGQPGATRGNNEIVGTFEGPAMQGTSGASMPVVVDPVTGAALPASDRFSQKEYTENLSPRTRGQLLETLSAGDDAVGQSLKKMASDSQQIDADPKMSPAQKMQAKQQLKNSQDQMIWSAMRDPTQLIATRRREQAAIERGDAQAQRQGQADQERQAMLIQRRNTQLYQQAYKTAESRLSSDPFRSASPEEINSAALQIYLQSGGTMPGQDQSSNTGSARGAPSGTAVAPGGMTNTAPKSGATDSISIDPQSPLDFQVTKSGSIVAMTPDGQPMRAMNFNGRAVAVPKNQAEIDLLPAGSLYVLEGEVRRGKMKEPIRKEGEVGGMSTTGKEDPDKQEFDIASSVSTAGTKKSEKLAKVRAEYAEYDTLLQDAKRMAGEKLTAQSGKQAATETGEPIEGNITPRTTKGSRQLDSRGVWNEEVQLAMVELATAKYGDKEKLPPSWVKRSGSKITGVDAPVSPEGFDPKSDAANDANLSEQEQEKVRQDYFGSKGTTESEVYMERLLDESKKSVGAVTFDRSGKQSVTVAGRTYPAVSVKVGNTSGRLPTAAMQPGKTEEDVARDALSLMISGKPFAIDVQGKMVPFKFDAKDPYFKAFALAKTVESGEISALQGAANKSLGAKAAFNFVNQVFGNLPVKSRKYILDNILTNQQLGKNFGGYSLTG